MLQPLKTKYLSLPAILWLICIPVHIALTWGDAIDIHMHDTYFVISAFHAALPFYLLFAGYFFMYNWLQKHRLTTRTVLWLHAGLSIFCLFVTFLLPYNNPMLRHPIRYSDFTPENQFSRMVKENLLLFGSVALLIILQAVFMLVSAWCLVVYFVKRRGNTPV